MLDKWWIIARLLLWKREILTLSVGGRLIRQLV